MVSSVRTAGNVIMLADATSPGDRLAASQPSATPAWRSPYQTRTADRGAAGDYCRRFRT